MKFLDKNDYIVGNFKKVRLLAMPVEILYFTECVSNKSASL